MEGEAPLKRAVGQPDYSALLTRFNKWRRMNAEALSILTCSISDAKMKGLVNETSAKTLFEKLCDYMHGQMRMQRMRAGQELTSLHMESTEPLAGYLDRAADIAARCEAAGRDIPTEDTVFYTLEGLTSPYADSIRILEKESDLSFGDMRIQLLLEEQTMNKRKEGHSNESAYHARTASRGRQWRKPQHNNGAKRGCFACGVHGHFARECKYRVGAREHGGRSDSYHKDKRERQKPKTYQSSGLKEERAPSFPEGGFVMREEIVNSVDLLDRNTTTSWVIDSGATVHITNDVRLLSETQSLNKRILTAKNGVNVDVQCQGRTHIITETGRSDVNVINVDKVLHVPDARNNLLSVFEIVQKDNTVIFDRKNGARIFGPRNQLLARAPIQDKMFVLQGTSAPVASDRMQCLEVSKPIPVSERKELWHRRLGHVNEQYINKLQHDHLVEGLDFPHGKLGMCDSCMQSKTVALPYPSIQERWSTRPMQLFHMDLCGPIRTESLGGSKYILTIVDDYSRRSFVYFLKQKSQTLEKVQDFIAVQEGKTDLRVVGIRTDNGTEFKNSEFDRYLKEKGISHQLTTTYSPQTNGVAERMNRSLLDIARTLLLDAALPLSFWAEAVAAASHVRNVFPVKGQKVTPMEMWQKRKPTVKYLRVFGCLAYCVVPRSKRTKFEPRAKPMILVGYAKERRGYRVYNPDTRRVEEVRNVRFNENRKAFHLIFISVPHDPHKEADWLRYPKECADGWNKSTSEEREEEMRTPEREYQTEDPLLLEQERPLEPEFEQGGEATPPRSGRPSGTTREAMQERRRKEQSEAQDQALAQGLRRSKRLNKYPSQEDQINILEEIQDRTPSTFQESMMSPDADKWRQAMEQEMSFLKLHGVWKLRQRNPQEKILRSK